MPICRPWAVVLRRTASFGRTGAHRAALPVGGQCACGAEFRGACKAQADGILAKWQSRHDQDLWRVDPLACTGDGRETGCMHCGATSTPGRDCQVACLPVIPSVIVMAECGAPGRDGCAGLWASASTLLLRILVHSVSKCVSPKSNLV
jgi:hypothetical protein